MIKNAFNMLKQLHQTIRLLQKVHKEYKKLLNFSLHKKDWKKFGSNNKTIALNILFVLYNSKKIRHA